MKTPVRTFLVPGACFLLWAAGGLAWADDKAAAAGASAPASIQAPDLGTYDRPVVAPENSGLDPSAVTGLTEAPATSPAPADPERQKAAEKEQNWLFHNIADQQKADLDRARAARGLPPEKEEDPDQKKSDPASLLLYPAVSLTPPKPEEAAQEEKDEKNGKAGAAAKDGSPTLSLAKESNGPLGLNAIAKPDGDSMNQFQPMIKGLSLDTSKPLAGSALPLADDSDKIPKIASALGGIKITPLNPDLVKPIDFGANRSSSEIANSSGPLAIAPASIQAPAFDIPSLTSPPTFNSSSDAAIAAPSAPAMPLPPSVAAITPLSPLDHPAPPTLPGPAPTPSHPSAPAYPFIPTAGPSKPKVNDPLDMTFVH